MKKCPMCGIEKEFKRGLFNISIRENKNGTRRTKGSHCSECCAKKAREYRANNIEWYRQSHAEYNRKKYSDNVEHKLRVVLRVRLRDAISGRDKSGSHISLLGCSIDELKAHLESKFRDGMNWNNWSKDGWHVDHCRPLSAFDLTDPVQLSEACNWRNLQPLWAPENLRKGDREEV